jgi:hypothetical protein
VPPSQCVQAGYVEQLPRRAVRHRRIEDDLRGRADDVPNQPG